MPAKNLTVQYYYKINEKDRTKPPTEIDIEETQNLLYDFGIYATIPNFKTRSQLYEWRNRVIMEKLK